MLDETPHKLIPQVPAQPFQGRPHLPLSHLEPGDWTLVPKHGLAFAISATEILVPNKTAQRPPPSHLDGSNDPPAPSKKQKRQKKPEKVEIAPVPRRKRDETEKPPLSKKLTAEQEARKEKERYWEYHQVESEPLTREQLVAESQQTSALVLTASKPRLLRPVVPSIDDLVPFQPLRPLLQFLLPRRGEVHGTALAPGDFVVVINDKRENSFGTILLIRDTPQYGRVVKVSGSRRLTLDYQLGRSREQLEDLSPASLFKVKGSKKAIWKVRRHPLDPTPPLRIGDRLCVVDDKHLEGAVGRIEKIDLEELRYRGEMITVRTTNGTVARLRTDSFHRIFYAGDEVEIVRGPQRGQCGIVMEVLFGGSLLRLLVDATPTEAATQESVTAFFAEGVPLEGSEQRLRQLDFAWHCETTPSGPQDDDPLPPNASKSEMIFHQIDRDLAASQIIRELLKQRQEQQSLIFASKGVEMTQLEHEKRLQEIDNEIRVHVGLAEDRKREADSNRMMGVGRRFENVTVFIYKGPNKGLTGKIIGDHDTEARRDREKDLRKRKNTMELDDTAGIIVTVRVPNVGDLQVPIEKCTRGRNRVPLASTLSRTTSTSTFNPPPPPSASGESEELWAPGPSRPPRLAPKWPETLPAESDGTWLASSKLLHKRLDVHIFGVLGAPGAISARVKTCEQGIGFVLLDKKPAGRSPQRENVKVYAVNGTLPPTAIPLFAVRPVRFGPDSRVGTTAQKALTMADSAASLCDIKERVVIIGPNIDGKNADFGEYAETIPEEKLDGENLTAPPAQLHNMPLLTKTRGEKKRAREREKHTVAIVEGPQHAHYLTKPAAGQEPLVHLPNNRTLVQKLVPRSSVQDFPQHSMPPPSEDFAAAHHFAEAAAVDNYVTPLSPSKGAGASPSKRGRHRDGLQSQWATWDRELIPRLIPDFVRLWHKTQGLRHADKLSLPVAKTCHCTSVLCKITVVRFTVMEDLELRVCDCNPAAEQLLSAGLFPCAPRRPTLAVDLRLLELAKKLFVRIAPNKTAWTSTLEDFLGSLGFTLAHEGSLRRLFSSALEWYIHLRHMVDKHFDDKLEDTRLAILKESAEARGDATVTPTLAEDSSGASDSRVEEEEGAGRKRGRQPSRRATSRARSASPTPAPNAGRKRARQPTPEPAPNPFTDPPPMSRPSEYLRKRCPLCFGGATHDPSVIADIFVCVDACFTQKRNKAAPDPPKRHPGTHFVSEDLSVKMEAYVEGVRGSKPGGTKGRKKARVDVEESDDEDEDGYEHAHLKLPKSVLDECEASFQAADEKREKASTQFLRRHCLDGAPVPPRPRTLVGKYAFRREKQFNVLLLAEMLFQHLPPKLERSARKWGFLERYIDRLNLRRRGVSRFGHDWRCQLLNHPRKRPGFGFTNARAASAFGHSVSHLIAHLRISSYHHRLYTLDTQVKHADEANLFKLAEWIRRRTLHSANKRVQAEAELRRCGHSREFLREQWKQQVKAQTKPLAHAVLALRSALATHKSRASVCEAAELDAILSGVEEDIIDTKMAAQAAQEAVEKLKKQLRRKESALGGHRNSNYVAHPLGCSKETTCNRQANAEYNKLCTQIATEIREKRAPPNAIAPKRIDPKTLFKLEKPPPWLSSETVRSGINAMLEVDRADEEDRILLKEARSMRVWFSEDWRVGIEGCRRAVRSLSAINSSPPAGAVGASVRDMEEIVALELTTLICHPGGPPTGSC
ncbi:hypothetical protein C8R43DRAFT_1128849 [Mycena crocata]|nr:hypothetical protein C8R43DRAFT_1128849 [Mycena crocata]